MQIPILSGSRFYVYEHTRNDTGAVFYVGKGTGNRATVTSRHHRSQWWQRIVKTADGFTVRVVAGGLDEELAFLGEVERINQLRRLGVLLCNMTDGGDGIAGCIRTPEWREKIGKAHRGKVISQETRDKISQSVAACGYTPTPEARKKMSQAHLGHKYTLGRVQTEAEKQKRSASLKGNKSRTGQTRSADERRLTSIAMRGRTQSIIECPHCGKSGGNSMRRWHFESCKTRTPS